METTVKTPITREGLIDKLIEHRADNWDREDTIEILEHGRTGFAEMTNEVLEEIANQDYCLVDEELHEVCYHITDADRSKPSAEDLLREALEALKGIVRELDSKPIKTVLHGPDTELFKKYCNAKAIIAKAEGR